MNYRYRLYGLTFDSNIILSKLLEEPDNRETEAYIHFGKVADQVREESMKIKGIGYKKDEFWFKNDKAIYHIYKGKHIDVELHSGIEEEEAIPFVLGYCISHLFEQRNMLAIHSSCVAMHDKSIIIAGFSGSGKSSLTTRLIEEGNQLMADDIAIVGLKDGKAMTYPGFPHQNLCVDLIEQYGYDMNNMKFIDEDREKYAMNRSNEFCMMEKELSAIYIIEPREVEEVVFREIIGIEKLKKVMDNFFNRELLEVIGINPNRMENILKVIKDVSLYIINRPIVGDSTKEQVKWVYQSLR